MKTDHYQLAMPGNIRLVVPAGTDINSLGLETAGKQFEVTIITRDHETPDDSDIVKDIQQQGYSIFELKPEPKDSKAARRAQYPY